MAISAKLLYWRVNGGLTITKEQWIWMCLKMVGSQKRSLLIKNMLGKKTNMVKQMADLTIYDRNLISEEGKWACRIYTSCGKLVLEMGCNGVP